MTRHEMWSQMIVSVCIPRRLRGVMGRVRGVCVLGMIKWYVCSCSPASNPDIRCVLGGKGEGPRPILEEPLAAYCNRVIAHCRLLRSMSCERSFRVCVRAAHVSAT